MAQDTVKSNLKAPDTAKFPAYDENNIKDLGNYEYEISSYVDAQNSFGADLRNNFDVKLKITNPSEDSEDGSISYNIEDCQIDGN
ncbi:MAG: hypothetical protein ABF633_01800 [Clostridium sp.]|uniref:hypothetical protein n=1 Tax=Clostridium sp. TaxID=1506 RepID=UPI0039E745F2